MIIGVDVVNEGRKAIIGLTASYSRFYTQFYSAIVKQELHKELIKDTSKDEQENMVAGERTVILAQFINDALKKYQEWNEGNLPKSLFLYRDGIGGPTMA